MAAESFDFDYEAETILVDGVWQDREELASRIKAMIEKGDYRVARLSSALEALETALAEGRILALRVSPAEAEAVEEAAAARGCSPAALLREALAAWLHALAPAGQVSEEAPVPEAAQQLASQVQPALQGKSGGELPAPAPREVQVTPPLPPPQLEASQQQAGGEAAAAEGSDFAQRWFGQ